MDFASICLSIATLVLIAVIVPALWRYCVVKYKLRHLKGPRGLPFIGNILQFGEDNVEFTKIMNAWAEEFRDAGCFVIYLGTKPILIVFNANHMEAILRNTKLDQKSFSYFFLEDWLGKGLLLSEGPKWSSRRKLLTPSFHFSMLGNFLDVINEHATDLSDKMCSLVNETDIELLGIISLCSLDILNECMMGQQLGAQQGRGKDYIEAVQEMGDILMERFLYPWLWNDMLFRWSTPGKRHARLLKTLHKITRKVIQDRKLEMQTQSHRTIDDKTQGVRKRRKLALLDLLLEAQRQDNTLTDEGIQEEVDTFMFEGHDTVSASTTFALYLIGRHPEVQRKIQQELDEVFGEDRNRPVTMEDLQKLEYLGCVMKEAQRVLNTVPFIAREVIDDLNVCGAVVPKGTTLNLGLFWLHHDPNYFPDPHKFDPDRFLPANSEGRHHFAFVPFSAGHRNCIGQKFAVMEQKVILSTILRKIEVTSLQTIEELKLSCEMILRATSGVHVKLSLRP